MSIRRKCSERTCKNGRRCLEHLRFDVMWHGKRYRMSVNAYAIPRMQPGKQRPIQSMEEARDWERRFIGEVKAGLDPTRPPERPKNEKTEIENVSEFLDAYFERCAKPAGLRSIGSVRSQIGVLKENLGNLPLAALEDADEINRFKTDSDWAEDVELASMPPHRADETRREGRARLGYPGAVRPRVARHDGGLQPRPPEGARRSGEGPGAGHDPGRRSVARPDRCSATDRDRERWFGIESYVTSDVTTGSRRS
jgi:hypothetical protein